MNSLFNSKRAATLDNFYVMLQMFMAGIFLIVMFMLWSKLTTSSFNDLLWSQSSVGTGIKNNAQKGMDILDFTFVAAFVGLHIGILVLAFFLRSHPIVYLAGIFLIITLVMVAVPLSNAWVDITDETNPDIITYRNSIPTFHFIMTQLPKMEMLWGFMTLIMLGGFARSEGMI